MGVFWLARLSVVTCAEVWQFAFKDKTVVLVTHRTPLLSLMDASAVMDRGKVTRFGARDHVLKELSGPDGNN